MRRYTPAYGLSRLRHHPAINREIVSRSQRRPCRRPRQVGSGAGDGGCCGVNKRSPERARLHVDAGQGSRYGTGQRPGAGRHGQRAALCCGAGCRTGEGNAAATEDGDGVLLRRRGDVLRNRSGRVEKKVRPRRFNQRPQIRLPVHAHGSLAGAQGRGGVDGYEINGHYAPPLK